jgi:hypothetical protein
MGKNFKMKGGSPIKENTQGRTETPQATKGDDSVTWIGKVK